VYTKAARKLKMHEIPVIQRKLVYSANQQAAGVCICLHAFLILRAFLSRSQA
jgi:hypothetical protein